MGAVGTLWGDKKAQNGQKWANLAYFRPILAKSTTLKTSFGPRDCIFHFFSKKFWENLRKGTL